MPRKEPPLTKVQRAFLKAFDKLVVAEKNDDHGGQQTARTQMSAGLEAMDAPKPSRSRPLYRTGEWADRRRSR